MSRRLTLALVALCCVPSVGAAAKLSLMQRIERLESMVEAQGTGQAEPSSATADLITRLEELELELSRLRGELEVQTHRIEQLDSRQREVYLDIDRRLGEVGAGAGSPGVQAPQPDYQTATPSAQPPGRGDYRAPPPYYPPSAPGYEPPPAAPGALAPGIASVPSLPAPERAVAPAPPVSPGDPDAEDALYTAAFDLLKAGRYQESAGAFREFVAQYPSGRYTDNAQYWLGETAYVQRDFQTALTEFGRVAEGFPASPKVADALLKTGFIHYELQQWADARRVLNQVVQSYPTSTAARLARQRLQQMDQERR